MNNSVLEIIEKQIKLVYSSASKKNEKEFVGIDIENLGRLYIDSKLSIHFVFESRQRIDIKHLELFFKPRLHFEYSATYIYLDKIDIFEKTYKCILPNFQLAMEYFGYFQKTYETLLEYKKYNI